MTPRKRAPLTAEARARLVTMAGALEERLLRLDRSAARASDDLAALREVLGEEP